MVRGPGDGRITAGDVTASTTSAKLAAGIPSGGNGGDGFCARRHPRTSGKRRRVRPRTGRLAGGESGFLPSVYSQSMGSRASPPFIEGACVSAKARHPSPRGRGGPVNPLNSSTGVSVRLGPNWLKSLIFGFVDESDGAGVPSGASGFHGLLARSGLSERPFTARVATILRAWGWRVRGRPSSAGVPRFVRQLPARTLLIRVH